MPKKIITKMSEIGAAEFGTLLQEGKIVKMRAGKATIEQTITKRGKKTVKTFHLNLKPQLVHQEVDPDAVTAPVKTAPVKTAPVTKAAKPAAKVAKRKPGRPRKDTTDAEAKPAKRKPGRPRKNPVDKPATEKPAKAGGRKKRVKKVAAPKAAPPVKKPKKAAAKPQADMSPSWNDDGDELDDDDYEL